VLSASARLASKYGRTFIKNINEIMVMN